MNIFRLAGDLSHLIAIIFLLQKIWRSRSCAGISGRSQILFALVFSTRYLDLFVGYISLYNSGLKCIFIGVTYATIYLIYVKFEKTYDYHHDTFRIEMLILPAFALCMLINHEFTILEVFWTFSIYLESFAILPQLFMIIKTGEAERSTLFYLFALGLYKLLYIVNWIYRYYLEEYFDLIASVAGGLETLCYFCFFCLYMTKKGNQNSMLVDVDKVFLEECDITEGNLERNLLMYDENQSNKQKLPLGRTDQHKEEAQTSHMID